MEGNVLKKRKPKKSTEEEGKGKRLKTSLSTVRNKLRRQQLFKELKHEKNKAKREKRKKQRKDENWESVRFDLN